MYSSAMSQPENTAAAAVTTSSDADMHCENKDDSEMVDAEDSSFSPVPPIHSSVNQMLCASQTLDAVTLTPEVVPLPVVPEHVLPPPTLYSPRFEAGSRCLTITY